MRQASICSPSKSSIRAPGELTGAGSRRFCGGAVQKGLELYALLRGEVREGAHEMAATSTDHEGPLN